jgi:hypothetical protein
MFNLLKKIERFLLIFAALAMIVVPGRDVNPPKKKDYIGRIILSLFGLIIFIFVIILLYVFVGLPIIGLFR